MADPSPAKRQKTNEPLAVETFEVHGIPTDYELMVGNGDAKNGFRVHRFALAAASSTFAQMFADCDANDSGRVSSVMGERNDLSADQSSYAFFPKVRGPAGRLCCLQDVS